MSNPSRRGDRVSDRIEVRLPAVAHEALQPV